MNHRNTILTDLIALSIIFFTGCSNAPPLYKETQVLMGTTVEVIIEGEKENAKDLSQRFFNRLKELDKKLSLYNAESEIAKINKFAGSGKVRVSPEMAELLEKSLIYSELTQGAFDVTIAPLVQLWGFKDHRPSLPEKEKIEDALKRCGYVSIKIHPGREVSFSKPGMEIDLNAIAKGYIVGEGARLLKRGGVKAGLINAGGDIYAIGAPYGKEGWNIAIQHPRKKNKVIAKLTLSDTSVATSGDYENFFVHEGKYLSHIIDPKTGWPSDRGVVSATVISSDAAEADALATALIVMGKEDGINLINQLDGVEAIVVFDKDEKLTAATSSGLQDKIKIEL
jgi:thiamine biosynthesis lipoprotein